MPRALLSAIQIKEAGRAHPRGNYPSWQSRAHTAARWSVYGDSTSDEASDATWSGAKGAAIGAAIGALEAKLAKTSVRLGALRGALKEGSVSFMETTYNQRAARGMLDESEAKWSAASGAVLGGIDGAFTAPRGAKGLGALQGALKQGSDRYLEMDRDQRAARGVLDETSEAGWRVTSGAVLGGIDGALETAKNARHGDGRRYTFNRAINAAGRGYATGGAKGFINEKLAQRDARTGTRRSEFTKQLRGKAVSNIVDYTFDSAARKYNRSAMGSDFRRVWCTTGLLRVSKQRRKRLRSDEGRGFQESLFFFLCPAMSLLSYEISGIERRRP